MALRFNKKQLERLNEAITIGLDDFGKELDVIIKEKQVVPKKTGRLERNQDVIRAKGRKRTIQIVYPDEYASYIYENPDNLKIHQKARQGSEPKEKDYYADNRNMWARDHWLEPVLFDKSLPYKFAALIRKRLEKFPEKEFEDEYSDIRSELGIDDGEDNYIEELENRAQSQYKEGSKSNKSKSKSAPKGMTEEQRKWMEMADEME